VNLHVLKFRVGSQRFESFSLSLFLVTLFTFSFKFFRCPRCGLHARARILRGDRCEWPGRRDTRTARAVRANSVHDCPSVVARSPTSLRFQESRMSEGLQFTVLRCEGTPTCPSKYKKQWPLNFVELPYLGTDICESNEHSLFWRFWDFSKSGGSR
jgi:hypothetical protein